MENYLENLKVTIGITCFNAEGTIKNAIESALNQSWEKKEILIVDDYSDDKSREIINNFKKYKNIKIILNKTNMGASFSRNQIVKNSKGDIICFMDDDDISLKDRVKNQVIKITKVGDPRKNIIACTCSIRREYKTGFSKTFYSMGNNGRLPISNELANFLLFYETKKDVDYGFGLPTCCLSITKFSFGKIGNFDEKLRRVEDMDLSIRLSLKNGKFISNKEILVIQKSISKDHKSSLINYKSEIQVIKKYRNYLNELNMYWYSLQWPKMRYYYFTKKYKSLFFVIIYLLRKYPFLTINHLRKTALKRLIHDCKINNYFLLNKLFFLK